MSCKFHLHHTFFIIIQHFSFVEDAILGFPDDLKYLNGNTVVIQKGATISITCRLNGLKEFPRWTAPNLQNVEVRAMCPHLNESEGMHISYTDNLNEGSIPAFHCLPPSSEGLFIFSLFQIVPENVVPNMDDIFSDILPFNFTLQLTKEG
ncbi:hypothetical protein CDAR_288861 [Caerostris darwini]|uniref:Ig-like domain-containing protein n=1 Tax=Caerostris darwini TaxID=1538125 RepID=A0AAV4Q3A2_9ARAC|nr:hypothetical protein CDAR_288861 [Caerostris darwini]